MLLIVEDDKITRETLQTVMAGLGVKYEVADSLSDALSKIHKVRPTTVLLDMILGNQDGKPLITECKERYPETEIILISAMHKNKLKEIAIEFKIKNYISKPFELECLENVIRDHEKNTLMYNF